MHPVVLLILFGNTHAERGLQRVKGAVCFLLATTLKVEF
jgi:hypothetical protein